MGKPMSHLEQLSSSPHLCCCSSLAGAGNGLHTVRCWQLVWAALKPERQSWAALGYRTSAETQNPFVWIFRLKKTTTERCRNKRQKILRTLFDFFFLFSYYMWLADFLRKMENENKSWTLGFLKTSRKSHQCYHSFQNRGGQDKHMYCLTASMGTPLGLK